MHTITPDIWLQKNIVALPENDAAFIRQAVALAQLAGENRATPSGQSCIALGLEMAEILLNLHLDSFTIAAAILYACVQYAELPLDDVKEHLDVKVAKLIHGTQRMEGISELYQTISGRAKYHHNIDNIRKMLLAMVDDIRVVLIKLAERLCLLRSAHIFDQLLRQQIAAETMAIYAPLTHRLGIAQIKWELEDLAFKYVEPVKYQEIVTSLEQHFPERNQYIKNVIAAINQVLTQAGLNEFQVTGRAKHIYSIYRKMQRKQVGLAGIYDVSAIRVFVNSVQDCYTALSHVHAAWQYIPEEFDDYIVSPKSNNYRSIHTAVIGPENRIVEIQIRTHEMHSVAELGIAAHWVYKEGKRQAVDYEAKITWLRQVMDWQQEVTKTDTALDEVRDMFKDQVYVFTPEGDILDLPQGATPLDFAYRLHSELGHRCCGAKVNGHIVPLTYVLKTGERIEVLTSKDGHPSRDWLIPSLGYLFTSRARSKVFHWFKKQTQEHNIVAGQEMLSKELHRLGLKKIDLEKAATKLTFKTVNDLLAAIGSGDLKISSILNALAIELEAPQTPVIPTPVAPLKVVSKNVTASEINIHGIGNLLTHIANCCKPIPGEALLGYITQGKGIAIHRASCINALHAKKNHPEKFITVSWGSRTEKYYPVNIAIRAFDRTGLVHDITDILSDEGIMVVGLELATDKKENLAKIKMTIEISGLKSLSRILQKISKVPGMMEVRRE